MLGVFSGFEYLQALARRLVLEFQDAGQAGTPTLIGSAREKPSRDQLERVLPGQIAVGSGIVIDSYGGQSKQQDIVVYERSLCLTFTYNDTPESTFFPVEGVIAVGEVKSSLGKATIEDAFGKVASVKRLIRRAEPSDDGSGLPPTISFRHYGSSISVAGAPSEQFSQDKSLDQVFGFILAGNLSLKPATALDHIVEFAVKAGRNASPNLIVSLSDGHFSWHKSENSLLCRSPIEADGLVFSGRVTAHSHGWWTY